MRLNQFITASLIFSVATNSFAQEVTFLEANTPAPYEGFLFSRTQAEKVRLMDIDLKLALKNAEILTKQNDLLNTQLDRANVHIDKLSEQVVREKNDFFSNVGFFLLGAATATLITFGVSRAIK